MANGKFVTYLRVSTEKQGRSGLGLEAQRQSIEAYLGGSQPLKEFIEVESGKKIKDRPQILAALEACKMTGATLLIAKLDRLSRNVAFISNLMESGVDFIACDFPLANRLTIHILAAVAEHESEMISKRTREALKAAKARGVKLGSPDNLTLEARKKGFQQAIKVREAKADKFAKNIYPMVLNHQRQGLSLNAIARNFSENGILTARGKESKWTPTAVRNIIQRIESKKP